MAKRLRQAKQKPVWVRARDDRRPQQRRHGCGTTFCDDVTVLTFAKLLLHDFLQQTKCNAITFTWKPNVCVCVGIVLGVYVYVRVPCVQQVSLCTRRKHISLVEKRHALFPRISQRARAYDDGGFYIHCMCMYVPYKHFGTHTVAHTHRHSGILQYIVREDMIFSRKHTHLFYSPSCARSCVCVSVCV